MKTIPPKDGDRLEQNPSTKADKLSCFDLACDTIVLIHGPEDLSTNPKYFEGFGEDNNIVKPRRHSSSGK